MNKIACRVVPLLVFVLSACVGAAPPDDGDGPGDQLPDSGDPPGEEESAECTAAWECSDTCIEQQNCAETDTACIDQCDMSCNVETACAGEDPVDPTDPGGGDPAACDDAWQCSDDCGLQMNCADDEQCWLQCDAQCAVEQACEGVEDPGGEDPGGEPPATCDDAWACSDECGAQQQCDYDEECWLQCDAQCGVEEACAGEGGY